MERRAAPRTRAGRPLPCSLGARGNLVPPAASKRLKELVGTDDYTELSFRGGHIGIYVSGRAQHEVPQTIHDWLGAR